MDLRSRYERAVRDLAGRAAEMRRAGATEEAVARALHAERRRLAAHYKALTPEPQRGRIRARTVRVYGDEIGPPIEFLRARGKSWAAIVEGATRPGPPVGMAPETAPETAPEPEG